MATLRKSGFSKSEARRLNNLRWHEETYTWQEVENRRRLRSLLPEVERAPRSVTGPLYVPDPRSRRPTPLSTEDVRRLLDDPKVIDNATGKSVGRDTMSKAKRLVRESLGRPRRVKTLARRIMPLLRRLPIEDLFRFLDWLDGYFEQSGSKYEFPIPQGDWRLKGICGQSRALNWQGQASPRANAENHSIHGAVNNCLSLQAGGEPVGTAIRPTTGVLVLGEMYYVGGNTQGNIRWDYSRSYWRPEGDTTAGPFIPGSVVAPDPNLIRDLPGIQPVVDPLTQPQYSTRRARDIARTQVEVTSTGGAGRRYRRQPLATAHPPGVGIRERKVISRAKSFGIFAYKMLDALSEGAEVVDAVYDALPEDVKRRWSRGRRPGDNFGQYGLEGADWKLEALWHNWHRVDVEQAIENIAKNYVEDHVIGGIQSRLPKNLGQAVEPGEIEFAEWLDELLSEAMQ